MKRIFNIIILIAIIMTILSSCKANNKTKITLVLDYTPNTNHTGFFVAKEKGFYEKLGLEVEIVQPPEDGALVLVGSKKAEFCVSFQEDVIASLSAKNPLPITAISALIAHNTSGILSLKEKNITTFKDLEGKKYGSWGIPIYDGILNDCVKSQGGDPSKIEMIPNNATDSLIGIQTDFDATWVYEGWDKIIADTKNVDVNYIPFTNADSVFDYYTPVIATNNEYLKSNPKIVKAFLKGTMEGYQYAIENIEQSAEILVKSAPEIDKKVALESQKYLSKQYIADNKKWGYIDPIRWNNFSKWMTDKGIIQTEIIDKGFSNEYLP